MIIVKVEITSGYWVDYESLKNVVSGGHLVGIRKYEISAGTGAQLGFFFKNWKMLLNPIRDSPTIIFYLNTVGPEDICLSLMIQPIVEVLNEAPAR